MKKTIKSIIMISILLNLAMMPLIVFNNNISIATAEEIVVEDNTTDVDKYAVLINGDHTDYYDHPMPGTPFGDYDIGLKPTFNRLIDYCGFEPNNIYVLNQGGTYPAGANSNSGDLSVESLEHLFKNVLKYVVDDNDLLFVYTTDHGGGYTGSKSYSELEIDPGDEEDHLESDFRIIPIFDIGRGGTKLNVWYDEVMDLRYDPRGAWIKVKYVSQMDNIWIESEGAYISDDDLFIERLIEVKNENHEYDGIIDYYEDDILATDPYFPLDESKDAIYFASDLDSENICIDIGYNGGIPEIDARDDDLDGLIDWIDVNDDGDLNDWISIDETICVRGRVDITDDHFSKCMDYVNPDVFVFYFLTCFSGGFIWDLSKPDSDRIIITSTVEEELGNANFEVGFLEAFKNENADSNNDGFLSMVEVFNFAAENHCHPFQSKPRYDDNGDGIGSPRTINSNDDDWILGTRVSLISGFLGNNPPEIPSTPEGETDLKVNVLYGFSTQSNDLDGERIKFGWDWDGDGEVDEWTIYYNKWVKISTVHSWDTAGIYEVRVKAMDETGASSDWSDPLEVNATKGKAKIKTIELPLFRLFLVKLSNFFPILKEMFI